MATNDFLRFYVLEQIFLGSYPFDTLHIGLSTTTPTNVDEGAIENITEPVGSGYARVSLGGITVRQVGDSVWADNNALILFPTATGSWGTITDFVIYTGLTGDAIWTGSLSSGVTIDPGDTASFAAQAITFNCDI